MTVCYGALTLVKQFIQKSIGKTTVKLLARIAETMVVRLYGS